MSGISLLQSSRNGFFSQLSGIKPSARDSQVKMILVSPYSVIEYFKFLVSILSFSKEQTGLSNAIGLVKSKEIHIDAGRSKRLLFFTNLIGISLAATLTFLVLGYSNVLKSKKSLIAIAVIMLFITFALYTSFHKIVEKEHMSKATPWSIYYDEMTRELYF